MRNISWSVLPPILLLSAVSGVHSERVTSDLSFSGSNQNLRATIEAQADVRVWGNFSAEKEVCFLVFCETIRADASLDRSFSLREVQNITLNPSGTVSIKHESLDGTTLREVNPGGVFPGRFEGMPTLGDLNIDFVGGSPFVLDLPSQREDVDVRLSAGIIKVDIPTRLDFDFDPTIQRFSFSQDDSYDHAPELLEILGRDEYSATGIPGFIGIPGKIGGAIGGTGQIRTRAHIDLPLIPPIEILDETFEFEVSDDFMNPADLNALPANLIATQDGVPKPDKAVDAVFSIGRDFPIELEPISFDEERRYQEVIPNCCEVDKISYDLNVAISNSSVMISNISFGVTATAENAVFSAEPPTAAFASDPIVINASTSELQVTSLATDPENGTLQYEYRVNGEVVAAGSSPSAQIPFEALGIANTMDSASLEQIVEDPTQQTASATAVVEYQNSAPKLEALSVSRIGRDLHLNATVSDADLSINELVPEFETVMTELDDDDVPGDVGDGLPLDLPVLVSMEELIDAFGLSGNSAELSLSVRDASGAMDTLPIAVDLRVLGDTNNDGVVQLDDLLTLRDNWTGALDAGTGGKSESQGDVDSDADVDTVDTIQLLLSWNNDAASPSIPVPEPHNSVIVAVVLGFVTTCLCRPRR